MTKVAFQRHVRLKYCANIEMGQSPPSGDYSNSPEVGLPFLQGTADFGVSNPSPQVFCRLPTKLAHAGDILFSVRAPVGILNLADQKFGIGRGLCAIRPGQHWDTRFAWWALHEACHRAHSVSTGSTYNAVSVEDVGNLLVETTASSKQRDIARYLDRETTRLDALVAGKEQVLGLLAEKRQAVITRAVTRGLDPDVRLRESGVPWLGEIPVHWELRRAKFVFEQVAQPVQDGDEMVTCFRDGHVTLRRNRREEGFTNANLELGYQGIRTGQLVLHSMDAFAGAIGVSDSNGKCSPEYIICDPQHANVDSHYYGHLLRTMALAGYIQASCPAVRERAPRIRFSNFGEMFLPVPPKEEQRSIAGRIGVDLVRLDALRSEIELTVDLLSERRAALIAKAVTGQIDIRVIS